MSLLLLILAVSDLFGSFKAAIKLCVILQRLSSRHEKGLVESCVCIIQDHIIQIGNWKEILSKNQISISSSGHDMHLWAQTNKHYEKETPGTGHPPKHKYTCKCVCCCLTQCRSKTCLLLWAGSGPGLFVWHRYNGQPNRVVNLQYDAYHEGIRQMWQPFDKQAQRCALKSSVFLSSPSFAQLSPSFQQIWEGIYSCFMHWCCSSHSEE